MINTTQRNRKFGFTIVELLIVIVVIGILAAIIIAGWSAVRTNARTVTVKSDLTGAQDDITLKQLDGTTGGQYPGSLALANLKASPGVTYEYSVDNNATPRYYCLTGTITDISYYVSSETSSPQEGECPPLVVTSEYDIPLSGTTFTANDIATICASSSNAPSGYNLINGSGPIVNGTPGNDVIYQASLYGYMYAGDGNDILCLDDVTGYVYGQAGNDIIRVNTGLGYIYGDAGNDTMWSVSHTGYIHGDDDNDTIYAHQNLGYATGGNGFDRLNVVGGITIPNDSIEELF